MNLRRLLTALLLLVAVPLVVIGSGILFREEHYGLAAFAVAVLSLIPLFYAFERRDATAGELAVISVLIALSVVGRLVFAWLPAFKPVTAVTVIAALYLGREAGFAVGALSALLSNLYFGQGPWTPFQMLSWGLIGFTAGILAQPLRANRLLLALYGVLAGVLYSLVMDVFTTLWADGGFSLARFGASVFTALPVTAMYAVSNVLFLLLLTKPLGEKLQRIQTKYGLFRPH